LHECDRLKVSPFLVEAAWGMSDGDNLEKFLEHTTRYFCNLEGICWISELKDFKDFKGFEAKLLDVGWSDKDLELAEL
jgi:hypothetical protein